MRHILILLVAALMLLVAAPALAQQADPYTGVLPGDIERPTDNPNNGGDTTVQPDDDAASEPGSVTRLVPAGAERPVSRANRAGGDRGAVAAGGDRGVVVAGRQLPVTGLGLAASLFLAAGLIGGGTAALRLGRRRAGTQ